MYINITCMSNLFEVRWSGCCTCNCWYLHVILLYEMTFEMYLTDCIIPFCTLGNAYEAASNEGSLTLVKY